MRKKRILLGILCLLYLALGFASISQQPDKTKRELPLKVNPQAIYNYRDFKFRSAKSTNFNRFQGHSNLYVVGADDFKFSKKWTGGLFFYGANTNFSSEVLIAPSPLIYNTQSIQTDSVLGHLLFSVDRHWFVNLTGKYGQNKAVLNTLSTLGSQVEQFATANSFNNDWFVGINGFYRTTWDKFLLSGTVGYLHNEINQKAFSYRFTPSLTFTSVPSLINRASFILENAELGYSLTKHAQPFITGGLMQVVEYSNNRPLLTDFLASSLPELNLNQNGFQVGGGVNFRFKYAALRLDQQYLQRGSVYKSYLTTAALKILVE